MIRLIKYILYKALLPIIFGYLVVIAIFLIRDFIVFKILGYGVDNGALLNISGSGLIILSFPLAIVNQLIIILVLGKIYYFTKKKLLYWILPIILAPINSLFFCYLVISAIIIDLFSLLISIVLLSYFCMNVFAYYVFSKLLTPEAKK